MAWIKLRTDLLNDPAAYKLAALLKTDRFSVVGRLAAFWGWADQHAVDGVVDGASSQVVDDVVSLQGFAEALAAVNWLQIDAESVTIPNHDRHNGANAKERSLKSERQAKWRSKNTPEKPAKPVDGSVDGEPSTREEKRREEKEIPPKPPKGGELVVPEWIPAQPWADFVAMRKAKGSRSPFTVGAARGIVTQLERMRENGIDLATVLNQSVRNGWADVYPPKARETTGRTAAGVAL